MKIKCKPLNNHYLNELAQELCDILDSYQTTKRLRTYSDHIILDIVSTCLELLDILNDRNKHGNLLPQMISDTLEKRWNRIANTPVCYSQDNQYPLNVICKKLADALTFSKGDSLKLLMPSVYQKDINMTPFCELDYGKYMLTDDKCYFIDIEDQVERAFKKALDNEDGIFEFADPKTGIIRLLSKNEQQRLYNFCPSLPNSLLEISQRYSRREVNLYSQLLKLRNGMRAGDVNHSGKEDDAGRPANIAIVEFFEVWNRLPLNLQTAYRELESTSRSMSGHRNTIGSVVDAIAKPIEMARQSLNPVNLCMELRANDLDALLNSDQVKEQLQFNQVMNPAHIPDFIARAKSDINNNARTLIAIQKNDTKVNTMMLSDYFKRRMENSLKRAYQTVIFTETNIIFIQLMDITLNFWAEYSNLKAYVKNAMTLYIAMCRELNRFYELLPNEQTHQLREIYLRCRFLNRSAPGLIDAVSNSGAYIPGLAQFDMHNSKYLESNFAVSFGFFSNDIRGKTQLFNEIKNSMNNRIILSSKLVEDPEEFIQARMN